MHHTNLLTYQRNVALSKFVSSDGKVHMTVSVTNAGS